MRNKITDKTLTMEEFLELGDKEYLKGFLSKKQMAEKLDKHESTILAMTRQGKFEAITLYNFLLLREKDNNGVNK